MNSIKQYDIVFAGAGLSALTLAVELCKNPAFADKKIALIDREPKTRNDRTWCFWADKQEAERLLPVIYRRWEGCWFYSEAHSELLHTGPYQYYMVRGADFYRWAKAELALHGGVEWIQATVQHIDAGEGIVTTDAGQVQGHWVLNSALTEFALMPMVTSGDFTTPFSAVGQKLPGSYIHLLQHFKGWKIRTDRAVFDPKTVTFMDFRVGQAGDTRFVYVLPFSETEALVEYTVFSPALLEEGAYDLELKKYLSDFYQLEQYEVEETEFGVIPMTDYPFDTTPQGRLINIGTAGGQVKGSSGYAFKRIQRRMQGFANDWAQKGVPNPSLLRSKKRFRCYDSVFLRALNDGLAPAHIVFSSFFKNLSGVAVFRFLDEDSTLLEDFRALRSVPIIPFSRAAFRQLRNLFYV